jgi:methylase of polypeptide subunit release factors
MEILHADLFPSQTSSDPQFDVIVFNPPWIPLKPSPGLIESAIYDDAHTTLKQFLTNVSKYMKSGNTEIWIIMSDVAELLGLRDPSSFINFLENHSGLKVRWIKQTKKAFQVLHHGSNIDYEDPHVLNYIKNQETVFIYSLSLPT